MKLRDRDVPLHQGMSADDDRLLVEHDGHGTRSVGVKEASRRGGTGYAFVDAVRHFAAYGEAVATVPEIAAWSCHPNCAPRTFVGVVAQESRERREPQVDVATRAGKRRSIIVKRGISLRGRNEFVKRGRRRLVETDAEHAALGLKIFWYNASSRHRGHRRVRMALTREREGSGTSAGSDKRPPAERCATRRRCARPSETGARVFDETAAPT